MLTPASINKPPTRWNTQHIKSLFSIDIKTEQQSYAVVKLKVQNWL